MAFASALPLRPPRPTRQAAALPCRRGGGGRAPPPAPVAAPAWRRGGARRRTSGGGRPLHMAAPRFDGADFGDAALTGGTSLAAARRGVADAADGACRAQRVQLVRILLRLINLPRQNEKVRALIEALEAAPAVPLPAVAVAAATAAATSPPPELSLPPPPAPAVTGDAAADETARHGGAPTGGAPSPPPPTPLPSIAAPLSPTEAALHAALDGGRPWRLLFSSTTLGTPSSAVRLRRVGTRFYAQPRLVVNFAEWSVTAAGAEYTGAFLILSRYAVAAPAAASGRPAVLRLTFLEHQLRPTGRAGGGGGGRGGRPPSRVPPRPDRLVAALQRMLPAEFFDPPTRVDISHLAAGGEAPLLVTRSKGRRFAGVANVWGRDAAAAAGGRGEGGRDETMALVDRAVARVTGWLPPAAPAAGAGESGH